MKNNDKYLTELVRIIKPSSPPDLGLISESLNFEDFIIESSKHSGSYSREWVEAEVEKSGDYFTKEIFKTS